MADWKNFDRPLILASQSPRRKEILSRLGLTFDVQVSSIDEERFGITAVRLEQSLCNLAQAKARDVADDNPDTIVIGADTVVVLGGRVLGKPRDRETAREMIELLAGKTHSVFSAVALIAGDFSRSTVERTDVSFRDIGNEEIDEYLENGDYHDKAGAYAIQGQAMAFVEKINGCYYNVVGLPVWKTISLFMEYSAERKSDHVRQ